MAKKAAKKPAKRKPAKKSPAKKKRTSDALKERAHKVWLAGLGALAVAEQEGGKLFGQLVEKGTALEKRGKPVVDKLVKQASDRAADVRKKAGSRVEKVGDEAKAGWSKVESAVDEKVTSALHRMGIPTRKEIEELSKRVEMLTAKLDGKGTRRKASKKTARKSTRKPAKKAAGKTARKPAKKTTRKPAKKAAAKPAAGAPASAG